MPRHDGRSPIDPAALRESGALSQKLDDAATKLEALGWEVGSGWDGVQGTVRITPPAELHPNDAREKFVEVVGEDVAQWF